MPIPDDSRISEIRAGYPMLVSPLTRRQLATGMAIAALTSPGVLRAQSFVRRRRLAIFMDLPAGDPVAGSRLLAFQERLKVLGWGEDQLEILVRHAGSSDANRASAVDLVSWQPDVALISSSPLLALWRQQTTAIPTIFVAVLDPVGGRFVDSLARPGGNMTGFTNFDPQMASKWLDLLRDVDAALSYFLVLTDPSSAGGPSQLSAIESVTRALGLTIEHLDVRDIDSVNRGFASARGRSVRGAIVTSSAVASGRRLDIIRAAADGGVLAVYPGRHFVADGGLMSYGPDLVDMFHSSALYVNRALKGDDPGKLPVQMPTRFEMAVNVRAFRALGRQAPDLLLARADEIFE